MKTHYKKLLSAQAVANTTVTSDAQDLSHCLGYVIRLVYAGSSISATAKLQTRMSADDSWFDLPDSGATASHTLTASGGSNVWYVPDAYYPWVRLSITSADADAATCTAEIAAKGA